MNWFYIKDGAGVPWNPHNPIPRGADVLHLDFLMQFWNRAYQARTADGLLTRMPSPPYVGKDLLRASTFRTFITDLLAYPYIKSMVSLPSTGANSARLETEMARIEWERHYDYPAAGDNPGQWFLRLREVLDYARFIRYRGTRDTSDPPLTWEYWIYQYYRPENGGSRWEKVELPSGWTEESWIAVNFGRLCGSMYSDGVAPMIEPNPYRKIRWWENPSVTLTKLADTSIGIPDTMRFGLYGVMRVVGDDPTDMGWTFPGDECLIHLVTQTGKLDAPVTLQYNGTLGPTGMFRQYPCYPDAPIDNDSNGEANIDRLEVVVELL